MSDPLCETCGDTGVLEYFQDGTQQNCPDCSEQLGALQAMISCVTCGDDGIVELSEEDFAKIKPYLDAGAHKYPDGEEIQTMQPCPDCSDQEDYVSPTDLPGNPWPSPLDQQDGFFDQGEYSLADCINWNNNPRGDCGGRLGKRKGQVQPGGLSDLRSQVICETCFNRK